MVLEYETMSVTNIYSELRGCKNTWRNSILRMLYKEVLGGKMNIRLKYIISDKLDDIVEEVGSVGKTPERTLNRNLQLLIELGYISRICNGYFKINFKDLTVADLNDKSSIGEKMVRNQLNYLSYYYDISYKEQKGVKIYDYNIKKVKTYYFDFEVIINDKKCYIEYDGKQHFEPVNIFNGDKGFKECQYRDCLKNEYCYNNEIPLLRIPYYSKNKINNIVEEFILLISISNVSY